MVALLGFYQWRKQYGHPSRSLNAEARRKAHEALWQKLEEINLKLRDHDDCNPELYRLVREINTFFLQNSIYFDDEDQQPINDYVAALDRLRAAIFTAGDDDATAAWARTWIQMPDSVDAEIRAASEDVKRLRTIIKEKIQRVAAAV